MGYIIKYSEITTLFGYLKFSSKFVLNKLGNIEIIMNEIVSSEDYQGDYAKKIKDYFNDIQLPVIKAISNFYELLPYYVLLLLEEYMTIEPFSEAVLYEDFLMELTGELQTAIGYIEDMAANINNKINEISDFMDIDNMTVEHLINNGFAGVISDIDTLNQKIYDTEEIFYNSELYKLKELCDRIVTVIDKMSMTGHIDISKEDYYALFPMDDIKELETKTIVVNNIRDKTEYLEYLHRRCNAQDSYEIKKCYTLVEILKTLKKLNKQSGKIMFEIAEFLTLITEFCGEKYLYEYTDEGMIDWLKAYIPRYISEDTLIYVMSLISVPLDYNTIQQHLVHNREQWLKYLKDGDILLDGYIEKQEILTNMYYGFYKESLSADYNSCEIIALYNALYAVNGGVADPKYDFPELIAQIEGRGACLKGYFGTSPIILEEYIKDEGYDYKTLQGDDARDEKKLYELQTEYDTYIVTVYNDKTDITGAIHTMCITESIVDGKKKYILRNDNEDTAAQASIYDCMEVYNEGKSKTICIIGIRN